MLAAPERDGVLRSTPLLHSVEVWVRRLKAELLVLDAAADLYGGEENSRAQVRTFIQLLRGIALRNDCAILLLSHPSVDGMKTGATTPARPPGITAFEAGSILAPRLLARAKLIPMHVFWN